MNSKKELRDSIFQFIAFIFARKIQFFSHYLDDAKSLEFLNFKQINKGNQSKTVIEVAIWRKQTGH